MIPLQATMYGKIIARETIKGFKTVCNLRHALGKRVYPRRYRVFEFHSLCQILVKNCIFLYKNKK